MKTEEKHNYTLIEKVFKKHCKYRGSSDYIDITMAMQDYAERYAATLLKSKEREKTAKPNI